MINKLKFAAIPALLVAIAAMPIVAHAETTAAAPGHHQIDPAKKAEWEKKRAERLAKTDTNKDGQISKDEFMAAQAERAGKKFSKIDADGNGQLTKEEMEAAREKMRAKFSKRMEGKTQGDVPAPAAE